MFLASEEDHCIIFEDDVVFNNQTFPTIDATLQWLAGNPSQPWHCINLSSTYSKRYRDITEIAGRRLRRSFQFPILMSAILWNREGADAFLRDLNRQKLYAPIDDQLRYLMSKTALGLSFDIPPVGLSPVASDIDAGGRVMRRKRNGWHDLKRRMPYYSWSLWHRLFG